MADVILHNRPEATPTDNDFVAFGTPATPSGQIKMSNFYTLLMDKLGFFKVSNLFSEIFGNPTAMASARANLGVSSTAENTTALNLKADKTNVIEKDSTVSYVPSLPYHPVNVKFLTDRKASGSFVMTTPWTTSEYTINIGKTMSSANYQVDLMCLDALGMKGQYPPSITDRTTTSFKVRPCIENDTILEQPTILWSLNML